MYYLAKVLITAVLVVLISEVARRSTFIGAVLASVPVTSVLAMIWLYHDTGDAGRISVLATSIFWLVLPSLVLFMSLPLLLGQGVSFYSALLISIALTAGSYWLMVLVLRHFGVAL
ncbi:DUF3147 family protein [Oceanimonas marisflavi]|uniref:DUF3147 family protein n=1 Tax=Oceanimonas marisflavi TaxID=2059724 RepID=UPI0018E5032D|nr:DUF3147 family protein [Oceanimonas marisflavi]